MPNKNTTYEIGRRLVKGPRPAVSHQAASEKFATGVNTKKNTLNVLQLNISGMQHKTLELQKLLCERKIHVALLQEALLPRKGNKIIKISGYTLYQCSCDNCRQLVTLIRNDITAEVKEQDKIDNGTDIQMITVWFNNSKYTIYNVYNPPKSICRITSERAIYHKTIFAGDFNSHSPNWGYADRDKSGEAVEELISSTNLILQQDDKSAPTLLHRASGNKTRPDLTLLSGDIAQTGQTTVLEDIGSDHLPILIEVESKKCQTFQRTTKWNYKKANWAKFKELTDNPPTQNENMEKAYQEIIDSIMTASIQAIPRGRRKKYKPFWTPELERKVKHRKLARLEAEKTPTCKNRTQYNKLTARVKLEIKKTKRERWQKTCSEIDLTNHGHKAWKLLHNLEGKNKTNKNNKVWYKDGMEINTDQKKANILNRHFASVNKKQRRNMLDKSLITILKGKERRQSASQAIFEEDFTIKELEMALKKLKPRKAPGPDKITNEMLLHLGSKGKQNLLKFINRSWQESHLPKAWRTATITPILKPGKKDDEPTSYRPISLTSNIGKLAERMINTRLYWWLEHRKIINPYQAGFRKGMRTEDQLFRFVQSTLDASQKYEHTGAVFIDLKQAYDKVWRSGLLMKMLNIGIEGKCYKWIKHFLSERTIQTKVNNSISAKKTLEEGLPQGSALSCTLFLIFLNDLPSSLQIRKALFADDIIIWTSSESLKSIEKKLNKCLLTISTYCKLWKLEVNKTKTVYNIFTSNTKLAKAKLELNMDGTLLQKDDCPKYLGVQLDQHLNLKNHMTNLGKKANKRLKIMKTLASTTWGTDKHTLRNIYLGYVRSAMEYANSVQMISSESSRKNLNKIQNDALRFICAGMRSTPIAACEIDANVEPLQIRREKATLESYERYKRAEKTNPCKILTDNWARRTRLKKKSFLHHHHDINKRIQMPTNREPRPIISEIPPYALPSHPLIRTFLIDRTINKQSDPLILRDTALETIESYPIDWIHAYTDGSATEAVRNAGYGIWLKLPNKEIKCQSRPCGLHASNFDAEVRAIFEALQIVEKEIDANITLKTNVVIFSDSLSALQSIENMDHSSLDCITDIVQKADTIQHKYNIDVILQWIPSHCNLPGNDKADSLAKSGCKEDQSDIPISMNTAKGIIKLAGRKQWLKEWENGYTGRSFYRHVKKPREDKKEKALTRTEQRSIFQLRTGHCRLNQHLNRIKKDHSPICRHCLQQEESVVHHLIECPDTRLTTLRKDYLPSDPIIQNCLYSSVEQLKKTSQYHYLALAAEKGL